MTFADSLQSFSHYLVEVGSVNRHSRINYLSWLRYLSGVYHIDTDLDDAGIAQIIEAERSLQGTREKYNSPRDLTNFGAALRQFRNYARSNYTQNVANEEDNIVHKLENDATLTSTERPALIMARVGQGLFRQELIDYWHGCAVSGSRQVSLLNASHIKPWRVADNRERLDVHNGLLLLPNIDKLFDQGYITFTSEGRIKISSFLSPSEYANFGIDANTRLLHLEAAHADYLAYHRDCCFIGV